MTVSTSAGATVFIGTTTPCDTVTEYAADTWVEVGEVEDIGDFGDKAGQATFVGLKNRRVRKFKTTFDAGTMTIKCGDDATDAGQIALQAALASDFDFNFKVVENDKLTNAGTGSISYFAGKVFSKTKSIGNAENVTRRSYDVGINTEILEVAPT